MLKEAQGIGVAGLNASMIGIVGPSRLVSAAGRWAAAAPRTWAPYLLTIALVLLSAVFAEVMIRVFGAERVSVIFLAAVLVAAAQLGMHMGLFAAVLAAVLYNVVLVEPRQALSTPTVENWINLAVFLTVAIAAGGLTGLMRDERRRGDLREQALVKLLDASRKLSSETDEAELRRRLAELIAAAGGSGAVVLRDDGAAAFRAIRHGVSQEPPSALVAAARVSSEVVAREDWRARRIDETGGFGIAAWRGHASDAPEVRSYIALLIDIGAAAIARIRLARAEAEADSALRADRLRNALLSSISHDFRTPLATVLASAHSLTEFDESFDRATRRDLLAAIQEEAERLNGYVANLLNMIQLESGGLQLNLEPAHISNVIDMALRRVSPRVGTRRIRVHAPVAGPVRAVCDPLLLEQALVNLLENAVKFSPDRGRVEIRSGVEAGRAWIEVSDHGPGVKAEEMPLLFEKFYRSAEARMAGIGLGLSIVRGLVEAMGGSASARPRPDGKRGLSVLISLESA